MQNNSKIKCPGCVIEIDVQNVLSQQLEETFRKAYEQKLAGENEKFESRMKQLEADKAAFEENKRKENELFQQHLDQKLREEKEILRVSLKQKLEEEKAAEFKLLQKELREQSEKVKELNLSRAEIEKLKREKEGLRAAIEAESQIKLSQQLSEEAEKIRKIEQEKNELAIKKLQKQLEDQQKLTEEMKRKQEQGSMQLQGEVQELAIEEWLRNQFPLDTIEEIKKGVRGGDCIQTVHTRARQNCGTIYYESKRTKEFSNSWIEKFKGDMREKGADIGVIVTEAMPADMDRMGLKEGIWICTYEEFKALCLVLRESLITISSAVVWQENKGDKMQMLYDFLTSKTFAMQLDAIVEGFTQMKTDLDNEKRSMQLIWKKRQMQIDKVVINTIDMYGSIKGIAGSAIPEIKALELGEPDHSPEEIL